ncbi:MAG: hypothetical protein M3539_12865 [Acidobacteriota bacterium]|nr:hypothetical protein [Acidobacteriota bacterium]
MKAIKTNNPFRRTSIRSICFGFAVFSLIAFSESRLFISEANVRTEDVEANAAPALAYRWNLREESLPLINLPDHIAGNIDLYLTYSLDQFQFPLFQSLYFNQEAGKYILMVTTREGGRAEFIDLAPVALPGQFAASGNTNMQLADKGKVKLLRSVDGTIYTFARLADGELHCRQINDHDGFVIKFSYTKQSSIDTINDASGRTVSFSYTDDYVSSITQTWNENSAKLRKTWAIPESHHASIRRTANFVSVELEAAKRIPTNAVNPGYTPQMAASDQMLAKIFGGPGAVAAGNGFEPQRLGRQYPLYRGDLIGDDGKRRRGHLSFAMHLYGSDDGTGETQIYVPAGFTSHSEEPSPTDAAMLFYYPRLGNMSDVTLAVFHVAEFRLVIEGERIHIGQIGGRGGSIDSYRHSHVEFYRGNTGLPSAAARVKLRIDPASVFTTVR